MEHIRLVLWLGPAAEFGEGWQPAQDTHFRRLHIPQSCSIFTSLETQKRPNTEPQAVPEALETLIR